MENFTFVQFDIRGRREITDTDGQKLPEESLSLKYNVNSTPTIQFFKPSDASRAFELGRVGYLKPDMFLAMLHFVRERGYENGPFDEWAKTHGVPI
jgi:thioredoxin-related protein